MGLFSKPRDPSIRAGSERGIQFSFLGYAEHQCSIDVPTLLVSGRHDEATPALQEVLHEGIGGSEWVVFEDSSHMPHLEERERYMRIVDEWLARTD